MNSKLKSLLCSSFAFLMLAQSAATVSAAESTPSANSTGRWMSGEYHVHTVQSSDASEPYMKLENVLDAAFRENLDNKPAESVTSLTYGDPFDFIVLSDHLRDSPRDPEGNNKGTARWEAIKDQQDKLAALQAAGKYTGKSIYSGFEWDMMGLDHGSVGIIDSNSNEVPIDAIHQFEWLYSYDTTPGMFHSNEAALWGARPDKNTLKSDKNKTFEAIEWLKTNYPESYVLPNHPSRHNGGTGVVTIEDLRKMNDIAPEIVFGMEGLPGNQMAAGGNRSEMADIYGGADVMVAKVGGMWDAMLGEGRRFWNFTNSDFHFKVSSNRSYSSGYWPSEYSRNNTWVEGNTFKDIVEGMRSGKSYAVYGDLINALDFKATGNGNQAEMGGNLQVTEGDLTTISIRFKSPEYNNYAPISPHVTSVTNDIKVDHVDLISGEVTGKIDESQYASNITNETTKVIKRFTKDDWGQPDADGYYTVSYKVPADTSRYYRLRGTSLGTDVDGFTVNGEPLKDQSFDYSGSVTPEQNEERFNNINDRNYTGLWFYSNPIFVDVAALSNEQAITDTIANVTSTLGDTSAVMTNVPLPSEGLHGTQIEWKSSNVNVIRIDNNNAIVTRPASSIGDMTVTLTATISRGNQSIDKPYTFIVKAYPSNGSSGGGGSSGNSSSKPNASVSGGGGTVTADINGNVTITPDKGYQVKEVTINGISRGALTQLTGLKSSDQVVVTFEIIPEQPQKPTEPNEPNKPAVTFSDISNHWAASSIQYVVEHGLFTGTATNTFSPNNTMTRGMLVTVMHRLAGKPGVGSNHFKDVKASAYYSDAVDWASENNIVHGINSTHFAPDLAITREQLAQILFNYAKANKLNINDSQTLVDFSDANQISTWAVDAMKWSVSNGLFSGKGNGLLDPTSAVSRAEVATIIHRFITTFNL
ncbi:S-layer homology domain-containing protein [Cohnella sp. WQ 127256]|uniref:S-layer homology domain-containing protein n=1 Tax=Cohnella sp. WQ 127256 TaxID=2938790 RepID=UPI0021196499|nr:S-layer homology domain-containing protein [Cohnella sp. WQ 127256]